jgi:RNA polymerase sigma-70 factor (sigma-E family)
LSPATGGDQVTDDGASTFADFVVREQAGLLRLAYLLAGDRGHAEDLVQTALMRTYRHWGRVVRRGEPRAYVRRALVNTHTSWRRRPLHREQATGWIPDTAAPDAAPAADPAGPLGTALAALPPRMRATVVLRFYEDLSERQTAQVLGCSPSTVNSQATRGLARLRAALTAAEAEEARR